MLYFSQFGDKCTTHITKKQMGGVKDVKSFIFCSDSIREVKKVFKKSRFFRLSSVVGERKGQKPISSLNDLTIKKQACEKEKFPPHAWLHHIPQW